MIVDADCHISVQSGDVDTTAEDLLRLMDQSGVERALCWLKPPYRRDLSEANRAVFEAQRRFPDRIIGFGWANPRLGVEAAKDEATRCLQEYGFPGVKLNGAQDDYFIDDERLSMPVIEHVAKLGGMLAFHCGADAYERTHPYRIAKIAARFPRTTILVVHMGGVGIPHLHDACIEFAAAHPNMFLIGSAAESRSILKAIATLGPERLAFGSDTPFGLMHVELARYQALLRDTDQRTRELVLGGSILSVLARTR